MKINYDRRTYDFPFESITGPEAELLEDAGEGKWDTLGEWYNLLDRGSFRALKAALWVAMRRENPDIELAQLAAAGPDDLFPVTEDLGKDEPSEASTEPADSSTDSPLPGPDSDPSPNS